MSANLAASIRSVDTKFRISPTRNASGTATTGTWPDEAITASLTPAEFQWFRVHGGATWMRQVIRRDMQSQAGRANRITPGSDLSVPDGMHVVYVAPGATQ